MLRRVLGLTVLALLLPLAGLAGQEGSADEPGVVEVTARDFAFEAPAEIPSDWITFRMKNAGQQEHFVVLGRLPDGKTFEDYEHQIAAPFYRLWGQHEAGDPDKAGFKKAFNQAMPDWFGLVGILRARADRSRAERPRPP